MPLFQQHKYNGNLTQVKCDIYTKLLKISFIKLLNKKVIKTYL